MKKTNNEEESFAFEADVYSFRQFISRRQDQHFETIIRRRHLIW